MMTNRTFSTPLCIDQDFALHDSTSYEAEVEVVLYFPATVTVRASSEEEAEKLACQAILDCVPDPVLIALTPAGEEQGIQINGSPEIVDTMVFDCEQLT